MEKGTPIKLDSRLLIISLFVCFNTLYTWISTGGKVSKKAPGTVGEEEWQNVKNGNEETPKLT